MDKIPEDAERRPQEPQLQSHEPEPQPQEPEPQRQEPEPQPQKSPPVGAPPPPWELADKTPAKEEPPFQDEAFRKSIETKQARKIVRRRQQRGTIRFGLGMLGTIGWSIAVPTVIGAGLGYLIDRGVPGRISWTLSLLALGLFVGCLNAWYWVSRQRRIIEQTAAEVEAQQKALEEQEAAQPKREPGQPKREPGQTAEPEPKAAPPPTAESREKGSGGEVK